MLGVTFVVYVTQILHGCEKKYLDSFVLLKGAKNPYKIEQGLILSPTRMSHLIVSNEKSICSWDHSKRMNTTRQTSVNR